MAKRREIWFREGRYGFITLVHWKAYALGAGFLIFVLACEVALELTGVLQEHFYIAFVPMLVGLFATIAISANHTGPVDRSL